MKAFKPFKEIMPTLEGCKLKLEGAFTLVTAEQAPQQKGKYAIYAPKGFSG